MTVQLPRGKRGAQETWKRKGKKEFFKFDDNPQVTDGVDIEKAATNRMVFEKEKSCTRGKMLVRGRSDELVGMQADGPPKSTAERTMDPNGGLSIGRKVVSNPARLNRGLPSRETLGTGDDPRPRSAAHSSLHRFFHGRDSPGTDAEFGTFEHELAFFLAAVTPPVLGCVLH